MEESVRSGQDVGMGIELGRFSSRYGMWFYRIDQVWYGCIVCYRIRIMQRIFDLEFGDLELQMSLWLSRNVI